MALIVTPSESASSSTRISPRRFSVSSNVRRVDGSESSSTASVTATSLGIQTAAAVQTVLGAPGRRDGGARSVAAAAEPAEASLARRKLVDGLERHRVDPLHHELRDAVSPLHRVPLVRIGVEEDHPNLVAVAGIDEPRRVEARDAVP